MDPIRNPFVPGAGALPPELVGREALLEQADILFQRALFGRSARSFIAIGLRGVGKTVILNKVGQIARGHGYRVCQIEAYEKKPLPLLLVPHLRRMLLELDRLGALSQQVTRGLRVLKSFASGLSLRYGDAEIQLDVEPEPDAADSGDLEADLPELIAAVGRAAASRQVALNGRSKSYAERLFDFPRIDALSDADARLALSRPAHQEGASFTPEALDTIVAMTEGYPYFLQEWGYQSWNVAAGTTIQAYDVEAATARALAALDTGFFRMRYDRLTPREKPIAARWRISVPARTGRVTSPGVWVPACKRSARCATG
jgi:hypothetical protein